MREQEAIDQLAAILDGEDVPDAPPPLGGLADLATTVRDHADLVEPTAAFRSSLRAELVAAAEAPPGLVERARAAWASRTADLRMSARVAVATMTASGMIGSAGVAVAAQDAMPGETLYGLKGMTEDVRLALAVDGVAEARLHLEFARERLEELQVMAGRLDSDQVLALLAQMDAHSEAGAEALLDGVGAGAVNADEVRRFTADQRDGLQAVLSHLPLLAKPVAEDSLELLRRIDVTAAGVPPTDGTPATGVDGNGSGPLDTVDAHAPLVESLPLVDGVDVTRPGEEPAVPLLDLDVSRDDDETGEADTDDEDSSDDAPPADEQDGQQDEPEREPFRPGGQLTNPETDDDEGEDDSRFDTPTSLEQLPLEDVAEIIEDITGGGSAAVGR